MILQELSVNNYRNLEKNIFKFDSNINYIYGQNAQGKTNLLESIWMLTGARSFRGSKDGDLINFNINNNIKQASIKSKIIINNINYNITVNFGDNKRKIFINEIPQKSPSDAIGKFRVILFTPLNLNLIKDGPDNRRKFLDAAICQLRPSYTKILIEYNKLLKHRNILLKNKNSQNLEYLNIWDEKLSLSGAKIILSRLEYLEKLKIKSQEIYSEISSKQENLNIKYNFYKLNNIKNNYNLENIYNILLENIKKNYDLDIKFGYTTIGPHKDDLEIFLNNKLTKKFGSQGQQRSVVLSLKLSEADILEHEIKEPPVILLDDVMSELDNYRQEYLLTKILNKQVFITGCDEILFKNFENLKTINKLNINCGKLVR